MITTKSAGLKQFSGVFEKARSADFRLKSVSTLDLEQALAPVVVLYLEKYKADNKSASFNDFVSKLERDEVSFSEFMQLAKHRLEGLSKLETKKEESKKWVADCFRTDRDSLNAVFGSSFNDNSEVLTSVCGDLHEATPSFSVESDGFRVYLKPCSDGNLRALKRVWDLINEDGRLLDLVWPTSLNAEGHSWYESIARKPVVSKKQVARYYQRLGQVLCLAYTLRMSDLHYENIIAHGEYPVIIDYETLGALNVDETAQRDDVTFDYRLVKQIGDSVLLTGMLPLSANQSERDDVGAISSKQILRSVKELVDAGTLEMRFERKEKIVSTNTASPYFDNGDGEESQTWESYYNEILTGFRSTYAAIVESRKELLATLETIAPDIESRILLRNTREYAAVIDALKSFRFQGREESVWKLFCEKKRNTLPSELINYERSVLEAGLIPSFHCRADSTELYGGNNKALYRLSSAPLALLKQQLEKMGSEDLAFQVDVIEFSLKGVSAVQNTQWIRYCATSEEHCSDSQTFQAHTAARLASEIEDFFTKYAVIDTLESANRYWFGANVDNRDNLVIDVVANDLYSGRNGIEIALRNKFQDCKNRKFTSSSVYLGPLAHLVAANNHQHFLADNFRQIRDCVQKDTVHDVLGGNAGLIFSLADSHSERARLLTQEAANSLKVKMSCEDGVLYWPIGNKPRTANASFAHGNAGIGLSLVKAGTALDSEEYIDLGLQVLKTDDSFIDSNGLWVDTRHTPAAPTANWCNGTTGMVLSRYLLLQFDKTVGFLDDSARRKAWEQIHLGIQHILSSFDSLTSFSLCHGISGNLKLLVFLEREGVLSANQSFHLKQQIELFLCYISEFGWGFGKNRFQSLGLMTGLGGVKMFLDEIAQDKATLFPLIPVRSDAYEND